MYVDDPTRPRHMRDAAQEAIDFARGRTRRSLDEDRMFRRAVVACLQEIGEAASRTSPERRAQTPAIPWDEIIGLRHRVVREYVNIRLDVVWQTIRHDLPPLLTELESVIAGLDESSAGDVGRSGDQ